MPINTQALKFTEHHKHLVIRIFFLVLFVLLGWMVGVQPVIEKIGEKRGMTKDIAERSQLLGEIQELKTKNRQFDKLFSAEEDQHTLLGKISKLASESGFDVQSLVPTTETVGAYQRISFRLTARANFASIMRFLKAFEELQIFGVVSRLSVTNRMGRASILATPDVDILLETYLKKRE